MKGHGSTLDFILEVMGMILSRGVKLLHLKTSFWDDVCRMHVEWGKTTGRQAS